MERTPITIRQWPEAERPREKLLRLGAASLSEAELRDWMDGRVAKYKRPSLIVFRDELPKSGYGKVEKKRVRQWLEAEGHIGGAI